MMCARATDMISEFSLAIANNMTAEQLGQIIRPHPTFNEAVGELFEK
jgi:dihydrolipoamide dehydrogenase